EAGTAACRGDGRHASPTWVMPNGPATGLWCGLCVVVGSRGEGGLARRRSASHRATAPGFLVSCVHRLPVPPLFHGLLAFAFESQETRIILPASRLAVGPGPVQGRGHDD